jgi:MFS family permease
MSTVTALQELRTKRSILVTTTIGAGLGTSGALYYTSGLFYLPLSKQFGVSQSAVASTALIAGLAALIAITFFGRLVDHFGARRLAIIGIIAFAASLAALGLYVGPFVGFQGLYVVMTLLALGAGPVTYTRIVSGNFDLSRGRALGITLAGLGVVGFLVPTPLAWLMTVASYHAGYYALAVLALVPLPFVLRLPKDGRSARIKSAEGEVADLPGWRVRSAMRSGSYISIVLLFTLSSIAVGAILVQLSPILQSRGLSAVTAATIVSLTGLGVILGRVGIGFLMDKLFPTRIAVALFVLTAIGILLLLLPTNALAWLTALLVGAALGAEGDMVAYLVSRYFGLKSFGTLYALAYVFFGLGANIGPFITGALFDKTGSYTTAIVGAAGALVIAAVWALFMPRSKEGLVERRRGRATGVPAAAPATASRVES